MSVGRGDKPFWLFENGDMYLGEWRKRPGGVLVEHGSGITYNNRPKKYKGMVFIGDWQNGHCKGSGKSFGWNHLQRGKKTVSLDPKLDRKTATTKM